MHSVELGSTLLIPDTQFLITYQLFTCSLGFVTFYALRFKSTNGDDFK